MFNQFSQRRAFTPQTPQRPLPGQSPAASSSTPGSFGAQIKPGFMQSTPTSGAQPFSRPSRIKPDAFGQMSPQNQRAALYEQARQQQANEGRFQDPRTMSAALPGGLTERQQREFKMLQRADPLAAHQQLMDYQRNADIRYNKPQPGPGAQPPAGSGLAYRSNPKGPRPRFRA